MNFNLATNAVKYTLDSGSIGTYTLDNKNEQSANFGIVNTAAVILVPRNAGTLAARINTAGANVTASVSGSSGFKSLVRTASNAQAVLTNGVNTANNTTASSAIPSGNVFVMNYNNAGSPGVGYYSTNRFNMFYIGSSAIDEVKLFNRVFEYLQGKGSATP